MRKTGFRIKKAPKDLAELGLLVIMIDGKAMTHKRKNKKRLYSDHFNWEAWNADLGSFYSHNIDRRDGLYRLAQTSPKDNAIVFYDSVRFRSSVAKSSFIEGFYLPIFDLPQETFWATLLAECV